MKYENANYVTNLLTKVRRLEAARVSLESALEHRGVDMNSWDTGDDRGLYQLRISEHTDRSGVDVDLTGCAIGVKVLQSTLKTVQSEIAAIVKELETL